MGNTKQIVLAIVLPVIIIGAIVSAIVTTKPRKEREKQRYSCMAYAISDDGTIYKFLAPEAGPTWPVMYQGKELKPLYICNTCGAKFAGNIGAVTSQCPVCGSSNVGGYSEKSHGKINVIEFELPKEE
jgi:predicted RNA-binding Zn-ribbon protein involved in translation (DUF1610 family)